MPAVKQCRECGEIKALTEFYREARNTDGLRSTCKGCVRRRSKVWYREHSDRAAVNFKRWANENPERRAVHLSKSRERHRQKHRARQALKDAVYRGRIVKPAACERCQREAQGADLHGHHHDYSKPLEVEWLCRSCHGKIHADCDVAP